MVDVVWFRRDLRTCDNAVVAAAESAVPLFVLDERLWRRAGAKRRDYLAASLRALDRQIRQDGGEGLVIRPGPAERAVPQVAREVAADRVLAAADFSPFGVRRDLAVASVLARRGMPLQLPDQPYAQEPGSVTRGDGRPYSVFTPFYRAWAARPVPEPVATGHPNWVASDGEALPGTTLALDAAGQAAAERRLRSFGDAVRRYPLDRNRPDRAQTSRLGAALHFGEIHPRTILDCLAGERGSSDEGVGRAEFVRQLAWRDFYADVLARLPQAAWGNVDRRFDELPWCTGARADEAFHAWSTGCTGYPFVDAGMRQLLAEGWLHNRLRMVVASFLTKDLMVEWQRGARWFLEHLVDADIANNSLGWQWAAGTGMDAAPFHRIFNPVLQGQRFDPDGDFVRRYVPELAHLAGATVHEPWLTPEGYDHGYVPRIVDHAAARRAALVEYSSVRMR